MSIESFFSILRSSFTISLKMFESIEIINIFCLFWEKLDCVEVNYMSFIFSK